MNIQHISRNIQSFYKDHIEPTATSLYTQASQTVQQCGQMYEAGRQKVVQVAQEKFPPKIADLVDRISQVVPETLAAIAALHRVATLPTVLYASYRFGSTLSPLAIELLSSTSTKESIAQEKENTKKALGDETLRWLPAVSAAYLVSSVGMAAIGACTLKLDKLVQGLCFFVGGVGLTYMDLEANRVRGNEG